MKKIILVAGATGDLGGRIVKALLKQGADVRAIVRDGSDAKKIEDLENIGAIIFRADMSNVSQIADACKGVSCVVSALAGLRDVIVDTQLNLLNGAVQAGVPRFIPSDFATDFTKIPMGENRNFDLRKEFKEHLDKSNIKATSIFNGAFADIMRYDTPFFDTKNKTIDFFEGKKDWKADFTTKDETAMFTALAALDDDAPRDLRIASFSVSPLDLEPLSEKYKDEKYELVNKGSLEDFSASLKAWRASDPNGENNLYSKWQQAQYLHSMFFVHHTHLDNDRYPNLKWTAVEEFIK
jgi:NAD(P)-dependent dehydrogenase (short-subunit alcohol dehydrogenase family)